MSYYRHGPGRPGGPGVQIGVPRLTPIVKKLMIACAVVWGVQFLLAASGVSLSQYFGLVPHRVVRGQIWQPLTYMFLHAPREPFHLLFNMLMLWMFGGDLERQWGGKAFLRYYLVCGVGAGLCSLVLGLIAGGNAALVPTIGASGAIFGLIVAFGMIFGERTVLFMLLFPMKARTMAWILFGLNLFYLLSMPGSGVSYVSHVGGAVTGFLYLKRAWRVGAFVRELKWKFRRRRFRVMPPKDDDFDRWVN